MNIVGARTVSPTSKVAVMLNALISPGRKSPISGMQLGLVQVYAYLWPIELTHFISVYIAVAVAYILFKHWNIFLIFLSFPLSVLENVVFDEHTREVDYTDKSVTGKQWFFLIKIKISIWILLIIFLMVDFINLFV
jgi:hypothetical protein